MRVDIPEILKHRTLFEYSKYYNKKKNRSFRLTIEILSHAGVIAKTRLYNLNKRSIFNGEAWKKKIPKLPLFAPTIQSMYLSNSQQQQLCCTIYHVLSNILTACAAFLYFCNNEPRATRLGQHLMLKFFLFEKKRRNQPMFLCNKKKHFVLFFFF